MRKDPRSRSPLHAAPLLWALPCILLAAACAERIGFEDGAGDDEVASDSSDTFGETDSTDTGSTDTGSTQTDSGSTETETGSTETGSGLCAGPCGALGCGACPDPGFVDLGDFSISPIEVRVDDYAMFMAIEFDPDFDVHEACTWKADFTPDSWDTQLGDPEQPVVRVDWCDAQAYCTWTGGHLCGTAGGGAAALGQVDDAVTNEWFRACSADGINTYPYGDAYDPLACNGADSGGGQLVAADMSGCEGGSPGVFDLSGNAWEWTSACGSDPDTADEDQQCRRRGGSYFSASNIMRCAVDATRNRSFRNGNTGLRCCAP